MNKTNKISLLSLIATTVIGVSISVVAFMPKGNLSNAQNNEASINVTWDKKSKYDGTPGYFYSESSSSSQSNMYLDNFGSEVKLSEGDLARIFVYETEVPGESSIYTTTYVFFSCNYSFRSKVNIRSVSVTYYENNTANAFLSIFDSTSDKYVSKMLEQSIIETKTTTLYTEANGFYNFEIKFSSPKEVPTASCTIKSITMTYDC